MRWKWVLVTIALLAVVLMATGYAVLASYDYDKLKPQLARVVKDATGRDLNLRGHIAFTIGFPPALIVTDAVLANAPWGSQAQMITVDELRMEMRLLPLLVKNVALRYLGLTGVEVLLETDQDGQGNWIFQGARRPEKNTAIHKPLKIDIGRIRIENMRLVYRRGTEGPAERCTIDRLDVTREEAAGRLAIDLRASYNEHPLAVSGRIGVLRNLQTPEPLPVEVSGTYANAEVTVAGAISDLLHLRGIELKAHVSGTELTALGLDKTIPLPETSAFDVKGVLKGSIKALALEDISGAFSASGFDVTLSGNVGNLSAFGAVDLQLKGSGQDLSMIGPFIGCDIPATDQFAVTGRLRGAAPSLSFDDAQASARRGSLRVDLKGAVNNLLAASGLDLQVQGSGKNLAEVTPIIGVTLPATDEFAIEGRLEGSSERLRLEAAQGRAQKGRLNLTLNGRIRDLLAFDGVDLRVAGSGESLAEVTPIIGIKLPATDDFTIAGRLTGSGRTLSFQEARASAKRGGLNLKLSGAVDDMLTVRTIHGDLDASGTELAEIGPLVGADLPELGPFDMTAKLIWSAKTVSLSRVSASLDQSDVSGQAAVAFLARPRITARLASSVIDFTRLMQNYEQDEKQPAGQRSQRRRLFPDTPLPFDVFKKMDADILLNARNIRARDAHLEFGHLELKLENGDFSIDRIEATYKKTKISGNLHVRQGLPPGISSKFIVQGFDLGDFLKETGRSDTIRAVVDIAAYGNSAGNSINQLMAGLNGSVGAVMGKGYLSRYLDMLSFNLSQKVLHFWDWARRHPEKADQINCAGVQFDIKEGVATSRAFVFDSQLAVLTGEGEINLGNEQINFLLVPDAKDTSIFDLSTNLRVRGSLLDPKVSPDTRSLLTKGSWALSSLAIGPLGLLAPFVHLGAHKAHPCDVPGIGAIDPGPPTESGQASP